MEAVRDLVPELLLCTTHAKIIRKTHEQCKNSNAVFYHKEEGLDMHQQIILATPIKATSRIADSRRSNYPIYGTQRAHLQWTIRQTFG
jgi:hypothetical protein